MKIVKGVLFELHYVDIASPLDLIDLFLDRETGIEFGVEEVDCNNLNYKSKLKRGHC